MNRNKELENEYYKIAKELNNPNVKEEYLDSLLKVFSGKLYTIEEKTNKPKNLKEFISRDNKHKKEDIRLLQELREARNYKPSDSLKLTQEQKELGVLEKLKVIFESDKDYNIKTLERKVQGLEPYIKILEEIDLEDFNLEYDFIEFLENLLARGRKGTYKIKNIGPYETPTLNNRKRESNERLNSYFNTDKKEIIESKEEKLLDTQFETYYKNNFLVALKNNHIASQSELNRIKSISRDTNITEAIKEVIPSNKIHLVRELHQIQEERYNEYLEKQKRLI